MTDETPETSPAAEAVTNRLAAPAGKTPKPSFTQTGDWVWLHQALSDRGFRYYCAVRAFIFDADDEFEVDLTDEVIARLLGKTAKSVSAARRDCYAAGVIEELHTWKESVRVPGKNRPEVRTFRRLIVHHEVPDGWTGPVNAYAEKRAVEQSRAAEMKAKRAERQQALDAAAPGDGETPGHSDGKVSSGHTDQGEQSSGQPGTTPTPNGETPGQCEGKVSSESGKKSSESGKISSQSGKVSSSTTTSDQAKQVPYLPYHLPIHLPIHQGAAASDDEAGDAGQSDGWMDGEQSSNNNHGQESEGALLLARVERAVGGHVQANRSEYIAAIDAALTVLPARQVESHLGDNVRDVRNPGGVVVSRIGQLPALVASREAEMQRVASQRRRPAAQIDAAGTANGSQGDHTTEAGRDGSGDLSGRYVTPGELDPAAWEGVDRKFWPKSLRERIA